MESLEVNFGCLLRCNLTIFLYFCLLIPLGLVGVGGRPSFFSDSESLLLDPSITGSFSSLYLSGPSPELSDENSGPMSKGFEIATTQSFSGFEASVEKAAFL